MTDSQGIAYLTDTKLAVGTYYVTLINPATGERISAKATIVKRLVENKDITMDFVDGTYYVGLSNISNNRRIKTAQSLSNIAYPYWDISLYRQASINKT